MASTSCRERRELGVAQRHHADVTDHKPKRDAMALGDAHPDARLERRRLGAPQELGVHVIGDGLGGVERSRRRHYGAAGNATRRIDPGSGSMRF